MAPFTFLVSFYNAEKYIVSCVENLKKQSNPDFLCILVDDGSTDESYEIALNEIKNDSRFSVIKHEKNLGSGAGRATGIKNTQTEFLTFYDADDELSQDASDKIISTIEKFKDSDLFVYDFFQKKSQTDISRISGSARTVEELFKNNDKRISHVWHKVFRTSMVKKLDLSFCRTVTFSEDLYFCLQCFMTAKKIHLISDAYYYYVYNESSAVNSRTEKSIYENVEVVKTLLQDKKLNSFPALKDYLNIESFHTFGLFIFPNKKNEFQWKSPHFIDWLSIDSINKIFVPSETSLFVKIYISLIRKRFFPLALLFWNILKIKESINKGKSK